MVVQLPGHHCANSSFWNVLLKNVYLFKLSYNACIANSRRRSWSSQVLRSFCNSKSNVSTLFWVSGVNTAFGTTLVWLKQVFCLVFLNKSRPYPRVVLDFCVLNFKVLDIMVCE